MSRIGEVLKNKNRVEKVRRARSKDEMNSMRIDAAFKARLYDELKRIEILFGKDEIESLIIDIPDVFLAKFGAAIFSEDLAEYDIQQVEGSSKKFQVKRKFIVY